MANTEYDYDVLYIGSGHGTFDGAIPLAARGVKVGVIESGLIGGTCPNRGCNAKITLDAPVALTRLAENLNGVVNGNLSIDWKANEQHKHAVIDGLPNMIGGLMKSVNIDLISGHGVLKDRHTVTVDNDSKTAEKIVISTGQHPHRLDIPGTDLAHDSEDFMNLTTLPKNITIIGAGYISLEFATIANAAGSNVTVLTHGDHVLRKFYQPFVKQVVADLEKRGVVFINNAKVTKFGQTDRHYNIEYNDNQTITTDWILDATGRIPNTQGIGLDEIGINYNARGIEVNDHLQTSIDNIYASGDVIDKDQPKLTPTAIFESTYLMHQFAGDSADPINYPIIPSVVFTSPRIAKAGVSIEDAQQNGQYEVKTNHLPDDWYRQVTKEGLGDNALVYDKNHHLVGATEMSDQAEDAINTLLPAIEFKFGPAELERLVPLFPTIGADILGQL